MLYLTPPVGEPVIAAFAAGQLGLIESPLQQMPKWVGRAHAIGTPWCADNGCFTDAWDETKWWTWLQGRVPYAGTCLFATAPDVVGDAGATLDLSTPWLERIRFLGFPVALVAQDGLEELTVPWDDFDVLFLGGTDSFKLGPAARLLTGEARRRGKPVHMGRVNSEKRFAYARAIGCTSVDGTAVVFNPGRRLPELLSWSRSLDQPYLIEEAHDVR